MIYQNSGQQNVSTIPLHLMKENTPRIVLEKLATPPPGKRPPSRANSEEVDHKILISVHLSDNRPSLQDWNNWLSKSIPAGVLSAEIKMESMFGIVQGSIILVTLPLELGTMLDPTDEAFMFVGFVTSSNCLTGQ
ncbi:hypothetical protein BJX65DRAFT_282701 [Aspergillus insuetus]